MKFILTYDGLLQSSGNASKKRQLVWNIREQISDQMADLWRVHPATKSISVHRYISKKRIFEWSEKHHSNFAADSATPTPTEPIDQNEIIDLCGTTPINGFDFQPLVSDAIGLNCSLDILFLRKEARGKVYQGGDLDNRIKTLLDALRIPTSEELGTINYQPTDPSKLKYCLLEDDKLVSGLSVRTGQLLNKPGTSESEVRLVIEVDVRVTYPRSYNQVFLAD
jgi:hypothetical protein